MQTTGQVGAPAATTPSGTSNVPFRQGGLNEAIVSECQPRYYENTYRNSAFQLPLVTAAAITAFVGAAGGTPMLAVYNPAGSVKNLVLVSASFSNTVAASAAGTVNWGIYFGKTAAITQGTVVNPWNMLTLTQSGSVATGFANVALTSSTAATNFIGLGAYYWATAAGAALVTPAPIDLGGQIIIPPGSYAALGGSSALTSATWNGSLNWFEVPV